MRGLIEFILRNPTLKELAFLVPSQPGSPSSLVRRLNSLEIGSGGQSMHVLTVFVPGQEPATSVPNILDAQRLCDGPQAFKS